MTKDFDNTAGTTRGPRIGRRAMLAGSAATLASGLARPAIAQTMDKVRVGVFPISSSLPFFVARDRGLFKEQNIEIEMTTLLGGPPNVAAMIGNQIDASAVLIMLEGLNANLKKPGVAQYIGVHAQTAHFEMEQFVVKASSPVKSVGEMKGKKLKLFSAPGPANVATAKAVLAANGVAPEDYTIDQLDMGQHVGVLTAGTFDGGYTLEPQGSMIRKLGVGRTLEAGLISKYLLKDETAGAFAAGCALTSDFISAKPDVAKRYAAAWAASIKYIRANEKEANRYLLKNTPTPEEIVDLIPPLGYTMVADMSAKDIADLQKFADIGAGFGLLPEKVDVTKSLKKF